MSSNPQLSRRASAVSKARSYVLAALIAAGMMAYVVHLFTLQVVRGFEYRNRATQLTQRVSPIPAQRGDIYDRNYDVPIVLNIDSFAVDIIPAELDAAKRDAVIESLSDTLSISKASIEQKLAGARLNRYQPIEVASKVTAERVFYIAEHIEKFPGVTWHNKPIRSYLETGSISHVLGYVNDITTEELQVLYNQGYSAGDVIGKRGVERAYDQVLRGQDGAQYRTVDVTGRRIDTTNDRVIPPVNGFDVVLTIDRDLQELAEKALGERSGSVIILKPSTGAILALVSWPWFDANIFYRDRGGEEFRRLSLDPKFPFLNRAIQTVYPAASTFKILMTTALIEEEAVDPEMTVECTGSAEFGDRTLRCWEEDGHGEVNLREALSQSCNVYFGTVGLEYLGIERISDYMRRFGFGERTGIDIPGEVPGLVPTPQWKELSRGQRWVGGDTVNASIGQGYVSVTPIQIANMVAMVANSGVVYRPYLVAELRDSETGELVEATTPKLLRQSTIRQSTFQTVQESMRHVVTNGTPKVVITTEAVAIAGKTGTGEVGRGEQWDSWFVAYGPYDGAPEDQVVVVVMVDAANDWEWWAPKAANIIFQGIFTDQTFEEAVDTLRVYWYFSG